MVRAGKRVGFTLVELLVVIGIIALLIGVLLPSLSKARKAAQEAVCMSDFRQWGIGLQIYVDQNRGFLPQKGPDGTSSGPFQGPLATTGIVGVDDPSLWFNAIPPLVNGKSYYQVLLDDMRKTTPAPIEGQHSIFMCPSAGGVGSQNQDSIIGGYYMLDGIDSTLTLKAPGSMFPAFAFRFNVSYVWNSQLASTTASGDVATIKMTTLRPTSEIIVMTEKLANAGEYRDPGVQQFARTFNSPAGNPYTKRINANGFTQNVAQAKADYYRFAARHRGGGFLLFADGHVSWYSWPQVQFDPSVNPPDANHYGRFRWSALGPINTGF